MTDIISIENLHYQYPPQPGLGSEWVLRGVDLTVQAGEFFSVVGPTASGKSTLGMTLNGIVPRSTGGVIRGQVRVGGLDSRHTPAHELAGVVGMVFQNPEAQLFNLLVEEEVAFGLENLGVPTPEIRERVDWALSLVGLRGTERRSPFELSGGQKQRLAIASVLAMTPKVLILDEPTASLDPRGKAEVLALLDRLRGQRGLTVFLIEQDSDVLARYSDRVAVLVEGRIVRLDHPERIFAQIGWLDSIGVRVPHVSRIAQHLNQVHGTDFTFCSVPAAQIVLEGFRDGLSK